MDRKHTMPFSVSTTCHVEIQNRKWWVGVCLGSCLDCVVRTVFTEMRLAQQGVSHAHGSKRAYGWWNARYSLVYFSVSWQNHLLSQQLLPDSVLLPAEWEFGICSGIGIALVDCFSAFGCLSLFLSLKFLGPGLEGVRLTHQFKHLFLWIFTDITRVQWLWL